MESEENYRLVDAWTRKRDHYLGLLKDLSISAPTRERLLSKVATANIMRGEAKAKLESRVWIDPSQFGPKQDPFNMGTWGRPYPTK
jgi:hypothetical protein